MSDDEQAEDGARGLYLFGAITSIIAPIGTCWIPLSFLPGTAVFAATKTALPTLELSRKYAAKPHIPFESAGEWGNSR
jgi:hypothetical protein